jgi:diguanylate cyclase (GGDEF)-like protein
VQEKLLCQTVLPMVVNMAPSAIFVVNRQEHVSFFCITKRPKLFSEKLKKHKFFALAKFILGSGNVQLIKEYYEAAFREKQSLELTKIKHVSSRGATEYYSIHFFYLDGVDSVMVFMRNITEEVLIEEEFIHVSRQYEAVNRELYAAMSKLDLQLMDIEQAKKKISALYRITKIVQKTVNKQEVLNEILNGITQEFGFASVAIMLFDGDLQALTVEAERGQGRSRGGRHNLTEEKQIVREAVFTRELVYDAEDGTSAQNDKRVTEVAVPLLFNASVLGVLEVETTKERILQPYDLDLLRSLAGQIAMTIAHAAYVAKVEREASTDGLTGLYNRRFFIATLKREFSRAFRFNRPLSLFMIDIDYFKNYNDTNGHLMGDQVLISVANLIKSHCREVDCVVRYGGEEFAVLLPETTADEAYFIAERVRTAVEGYPFPNRQTQPGGKVTVSIGIASAPQQASTYSELVDFADMALYSVKRSIKNQVCIYNQ